VEHVLIARMASLHGWLLGLPWVVERPVTDDAPGVRWFAVDCEPLARRRLWLLTGALDGVTTDRLVVHVVLPRATGRRTAACGEGKVVAPLGEGHDLVSVSLDTSRSAHGAALERMVLLAYEASFS
jgi:hypothetical protein